MQLGTGLRAIALATAGLFVVAACGTSGSSTGLAPAQELRVNIGTEPGTLDPGLTQWVYEAAIDRNIFEAPLKASKDFKSVVPNAADSYDIDSTGTVYTFHLHPGAKWSDGVPVKAADFVYAWQRIIDPRLAALYSAFFLNIKNAAKVNSMKPTDSGLDAAIQTLGLKAVDDNTFQVTLEAPAGYFKWVASLWVAAPVRKDVVDKYGKDANGNDKWGAVAPAAAQSVIGNGQFKISEVVAKDHITLVQNSNYNGNSPKATLTKITLYEIDDETVAYARYKSGELDMATVPLADTAAQASSPELNKVPELTVFWVEINTTKPPFDNVKVRQAFAQAIDRDTFVTSVLKGRGYSSSILIPKGMRNYAPELGTPQKFDPTAAKATLAASGVSASALANIKYLYNSNSPTNKTIAEFVQAQIKTNLGINLILDGTDSKTVSARLGKLQYQIGGPAGWGADYPDSQDWFDIFLTGSGNQFDGWSNAAYDAAVKTGDAASDDAARDAAYTTAETTLVTDAPVVFLYQRTAWWLLKPYVKGINVTPNDDFLGDLSTYSIQIGTH
jgi:oligopeptide transport system substrate-binding protein